MSVSTRFIQRPVATSLLMAAILLLGLAALPLLPVSSLPAVDVPTLTVTTHYPGASPQTMASAVAMPLETQLGQIPGLSQLTSLNVLGSSTITVQFELSRGIAAVKTDVLEAIGAAQGQLPKDLPNQPEMREADPTDPPILILSVTSGEVPLTEVDDAAETILKRQLSAIGGVGEIDVLGQQKPAIRVGIDAGRLAGMGLTLEDVRLALSSATANGPKGSIDGRYSALAVLANDQITTPEAYAGVIVAYRNGAPIRIGDIGQAIRGPQNRELAAWQFAGHTLARGILLVVSKAPGANVAATVDRIKDALPRFEAGIPPKIHVRVISDRTTMIRASVHEVERTLMLAIMLVVAVILVFLRNLRATLIPSLAVPLALLGTFAAIYLLGFGLDNLSLMGLTVAVGFVIDDAIVMLENIYRHIENGTKPIDAALQGAGEIGFTVVSISISLVAVFIPLLLMGGIVGRLFREFAVTVSVAVLVSTFVSLTLTPMMCARFLRRPARRGAVHQAVEAVFAALLRGYARTLDLALRFHALTMLGFVATAALTLSLYLWMPKGFFPTEDTGIVIGTSRAAQDVSFDAMIRLQQDINRMLRDDPAVVSFSSQVGIGTGQAGNTGRLYIYLKPWGRRDPVMRVIARLTDKADRLHGIKLYLQPAQDINVGGRVGQTMYQYTLQDADAQELNRWAPRLLARIKAMPEVRDVGTDQQIGGATATVRIDREQAARFGILPQQIDDILYDAFGQREVTQYFTALSSYFVVLGVRSDQAREADTLRKLTVRAASGAAVPLSALVTLDTMPVTPLAENHQSQIPSVTISFNLAGGAALGDAVDAIAGAEAALGTPLSLIGSFQGTAQAFRASLGREPILIAAALVTVYIVLGILYESYILPLTILSTLPSAGVGALLMLMLAHDDLSMIALIGIILLIGIVKKNGIMLVDFAIHAQRDQGAGAAEAIRRACMLRFRPIMMTTAAALMTGLPLMLGAGPGSELRRPLGLAMVGGLLLSQVLTLYTTPVVYLYLDRLQHRLAPDRRRRMPRLAARMGAGGGQAD